MAPKKDEKAASKSGGGGGKAKKKKWSKGKVKEKLANLVLFDKASYDKMIADVPKLKLITPSIISEKLKYVAPRRPLRNKAACSTTYIVLAFNHA